MPKFPFGRRSLAVRETLHPDLQRLVDAVADVVNTSLLEGARSEEQQRRNVETGVSKTMDSRHLDVPARAVDAGPYPIEWPTLPADIAAVLTPDQRTALGRYVKQVARWYHWSGVVRALAHTLGLSIRLGADWDMDFDLQDQSFDDLPHVELPRS